MAFDAFLKIEGIDGESTDETHKGWIQLNSFQWGVAQALGGNAGGLANLFARKAGREQAEFHFVKFTDSTSPQLFLKAAQGTQIKDAMLSARAAESGNTGPGAGQDFLKITFSDVLISSFTEGGQTASDVLPSDQVSLNFAKIEFSVLNPAGNAVTTSASLVQKVREG